MINIPSTVADPNYRYKMPKMILKTESKGNGVKTNITNLVDVSNALQTNPEYVLKFFGFEMGAQTTFTEVSKNNITCIIKGSFNYEDFLRVLDKFIEKYICCHKCKYAEMHMYVKKGKLMGSCDACGFDGDLDMKHDIAAFILKKPPKDIKTIKKPRGNELEVVITEPEITKKSKKTKLTKEDLPFKGEKMEDILKELQRCFKEIRGQEEDPEILAAQLTNEIKNLGVEKTLTDRFGYLIFNTIFDESISKQIKSTAPLYNALMTKFTGQHKSLQTLMNLQELYYNNPKNEDIRKFAPTILKVMNEGNIVTEGFLAEWESGRDAEGVVKGHPLYNEEWDRNFKELVKPFTDWLLADDDEEEQ